MDRGAGAYQDYIEYQQQNLIEGTALSDSPDPARHRDKQGLDQQKQNMEVEMNDMDQLDDSEYRNLKLGEE